MENKLKKKKIVFVSIIVIFIIVKQLMVHNLPIFCNCSSTTR